MRQQLAILENNQRNSRNKHEARLAAVDEKLEADLKELDVQRAKLDRDHGERLKAASASYVDAVKKHEEQRTDLWKKLCSRSSGGMAATADGSGTLAAFSSPKNFT